MEFKDSPLHMTARPLNSVLTLKIEGHFVCILGDKLGLIPTSILQLKYALLPIDILQTGMSTSAEV